MALGNLDQEWLFDGEKIFPKISCYSPSQGTLAFTKISMESELFVHVGVVKGNKQNWGHSAIVNFVNNGHNVRVPIVHWHRKLPMMWNSGIVGGVGRYGVMMSHCDISYPKSGGLFDWFGSHLILFLERSTYVSLLCILYNVSSRGWNVTGMN